MSDASTLHRLAGMAPPPEKMPSLLKQLGSGNAFEILPRAIFEQPVFRWKSSFGGTVLVHDPEGIRRVLLDNVANYPKDELSNRFFTAMFGEGLLSAEPEKWRRHRKIMAPAFDPRSVASYAPAMAAAAQAFAERWEALPDGADIDMAEEMKALTLRIICGTMFSSDAPELVSLAGTALGFSRDALNIGILDLLPVIGPMRIKAKQDALHEDFSAMDGAIYRMIEERERNLADAPNDLLTRLVAAKDPEDGAGLTAQEVRDEVITIFEAGHETTAVAMTFTWYLLSQHPEAEARLHAELDAVLGGRTPTAEDVPNLPYTRQVIEESMRLYPPAPAVTRRRAVADDEICGEKVNAGDRIMISTWVLHRHRTLWDDPMAFDPDRFSPARSEGRPRFAYMPFGAGPRICIGMGLAMTEATLILATLAQRRQPRLKTPQDVKLSARITLAPEGGLKMRLERRPSAAA
ncbi:MAG: cytochrome P450 [Phenylobacterium sp.]